MAAPALRGVTVPVISSGAITSPAGTQVGDLLIFMVWSQGTVIPSHAVQSGNGFFEWRTHSHDDGTTDGRLSVACKEATQAGAVSYTPYSITNATANQTSIGIVVLQAGTWNPRLTTIVPTSTSATLTTNAVPNSGSVASLTGDYYMMSIAGWHVTTAGTTAATAGTNYAIATQNANTSHVTHLAMQTRTLTSLSNATEDPPAFGDNVTPNGTASMTIAVRGITTQTSTLDATAAGTVGVAASARETFGGALSVSAAGSITVVDATVTQPGPTEHFSGALEVTAASSATVAATTRTAACGALAISGAGGVAVAASTRTTFCSPAVNGTGSIAVAASTRTTFSSVAVGSASSITVVDSHVSNGPVEHFSGALSVAAVSSATVAAGSRTTFGAAALGAVGSVTVAATKRETFGSAAMSGTGTIVVVDASVEQPGVTQHFSGTLSLEAYCYVGIRKVKVATHRPLPAKKSKDERRGSKRTSKSWGVGRR